MLGYYLQCLWVGGQTKGSKEKACLGGSPSAPFVRRTAPPSGPWGPLAEKFALVSVQGVSVAPLPSEDGIPRFSNKRNSYAWAPGQSPPKKHAGAAQGHARPQDAHFGVFPTFGQRTATLDPLPRAGSGGHLLTVLSLGFR